MNSLEQFLPTATDSNILDALYKETPIVAELGLEDFLKLPVNEFYKQNALEHSASRFAINEQNKSIISSAVAKAKLSNNDKSEKIKSNIHNIFDV